LGAMPGSYVRPRRTVSRKNTEPLIEYLFILFSVRLFIN
jgi:hypothetical protein